MSKSIRHYKRSKSRVKKMKTRGTRRKKIKAGSGKKVLCSICEKTFLINDTLVPRECLMKHGKGAHRICKNCWWDPEFGFALETSSHKCPGCQKNLPLTAYEKEKPVLIDLIDD
jgi:hypothetical protein